MDLAAIEAEIEASIPDAQARVTRARGPADDEAVEARRENEGDAGCEAPVENSRSGFQFL